MLDARVDLFLDEVFFFGSSFLVPFFLWWSTVFASLYLFLWIPFSWVLWSSSSASFHFHLSTKYESVGGVLDLCRPKYLSSHSSLDPLNASSL